jgi:hypothetical protein
VKPALSIKLPFMGHRHGPHGHGDSPQMRQVHLPFPEEAAKAAVERYRELFRTLAEHAGVIVEASAKGSLTHDEALAALQRHAQKAQQDLQALEGKVQP